ncbi:hypothetical protein ACFWR9_11470 [Streptomyces sp. NPDC058534]|uniref:hypothetical protein n=1 Tax=Streptomyces sp. NPDC058534 TaxID=3346541 RepID=UPI0036688EE8
MTYGAWRRGAYHEAALCVQLLLVAKLLGGHCPGGRSDQCGRHSAAKALTSVLTKRLQSKAGIRLGSRDERRQVYARFQSAATDTYSVVTAVRLEQRLYTTWVGRGRWALTYRPFAAQRAAAEALTKVHQVQSELLQAYLDLRLVTNPAPKQAADAVLDRLNAMLALPTSTPDAELFGATNLVVEAQREFTDVCRDDLWYLPKRWQAYRLDWWRGRRWRRHRPT